jgi:hypothetical protein
VPLSPPRSLRPGRPRQSPAGAAARAPLFAIASPQARSGLLGGAAGHSPGMAMLAAVPGTGRSGADALFLLAGMYLTWRMLDYFFGREKGGNRAKGGGPGGSEKNIVGVALFLAAVVIGIALATR